MYLPKQNDFRQKVHRERRWIWKYPLNAVLNPFDSESQTGYVKKISCPRLTI